MREAAFDKMRESAIRRGQTGFLHPVRSYVVQCGTETVHTGRIKRVAIHCFQRFCRWSLERSGKAAGQPVRLLIDGQISQTYKP